jgi:hypothetical protein
MFNEYGFGGYLVWSVPTHKVFIDGRGDVFEQAGVFSDYMSVTNLKPETLAILQSYNIQSCLIQAGAPLATLLAGRPDWKRVYHDKLSAIFVRQLQSPTASMLPAPKQCLTFACVSSSEPTPRDEGSEPQ